MVWTGLEWSGVEFYSTSKGERGRQKKDGTGHWPSEGNAFKQM